MKRVLLLSAALLIGGCETARPMPDVRASLNRPGLVTEQQARQLELAMTDRQIANMLDANVQAKLPTPVAIARLVESCGSMQAGFRHVRYGGLALGVVGREELAGWEKAIAGERELRGVHAISGAVLSEEPTLHSLRAAAAQMGCELLLVYLQADGSVENITGAAALYWTIIGLWVAPGNVYERKTVMQAALIDCRTGMILSTSAGECCMKEAYAAAYERIAQDRLDSQVPAKALADLQDNSKRMFASVVTAALRKAKAPAPPTMTKRN